MQIKNTNDKVFSIFQSKKLLTMRELKELLVCSERTVQRRLKEWKTYRSYNLNGRYYVLPNTPKFDENGLWKYKKVFFSKHGNLRETVEALVNKSKSGLNAIELSELIGLSAQTFLSHFIENIRIRRKKYKGMYVYFSKDLNILKNQEKTRDIIIRSKAKLNLPSETDSIIILVEFIKHFGETIEQLSKRLRRKGHEITIEMIRNLLIYHGIEKKILDLDQSER